MADEIHPDGGPVDDTRAAKPPCQLTGRDGNVYAVVGRVRAALLKAGQDDRAREFVKRAFASKSYDEVLALTFEYVEPS